MFKSHDPFAGTGDGAPAVEYRGFPRYRILQRGFARLAGVEGPESWRVIVFDISVTGVGVTLTVPLRRGTALEIEPWQLPGAQVLRARVVWARRLEFIWLYGCQLDQRLRDDELQVWMAATPAAV